MKQLRIVAWNIRTLADSGKSKRLSRRTAIIDAELQRFGIDVASLSETRFADESSLREKYYSFF